MLLSEKQINALKAQLTDYEHQHGHIPLGGLTPKDIPYSWEIVETSGELHLATDNARGLMAAFLGDSLLGVGRTEIITDVAIFVDRGVYGAKKWIWV